MDQSGEFKKMTNTVQLEMSEIQSQMQSQMKKSDAENFIYRIMLFAHAISHEVHGKLPIQNLISQCHQVISNNEQLIFSGQEERKGDQNHALD